MSNDRDGLKTKAVQLALEWCNEFSLDHTPNMVLESGMQCYGASGSDIEIILRNSRYGYWVELFKDGSTLRSVEIV